MNRVFSTIWNHSLGAWVVASEHASRQGKPGSSKSCALTTLGLVLISPGYALAANLPTNGQVILGAGTIATPNANQMVINQNSDKLAINWQSFDIGAGNKVQFKQPGSDSVALNRVLGNDGSKIMGQLDANGRVFLVNPNGVLFGQGAQVNVGGLVASTLDISNEDFAAGNYRFKGDGNNAAITNQGQIKASDGGAIALLGGTVSNQGTLIANQGTVALAAGNAVTLDFAGDGLLNVQVDEATLDALVENRQLIKADGGQVLLTADAGEALLKTVVNNTGVIEARTLGEKDGKIVLLGGFDGGTTQVAGTLDASAPNGGNGGFIETSGAHVKIADSAKITTKAKDGATGTWLVDPNDFTIAASGGDITGAAVSQNLLATNVELQTATMGTAGGSGDIHVNDSITWSTNSLTLTAERDININANLNASGSAKLALQYGQGAVAAGNAADYYINKGAKVNLPSGQSFQTKLGSDGAVKNYTVITSLGSEGSTSAADLQGINGGLAGNYVLGADIDASATASWESGAGFKPIGGYTTVFTGALDGLGHTISGLTINRSNSNYVGLIFTNQGELRNMGLLGGSVTGANYVGGLAGYTGSGSVISNVYATGAVTGYSVVGGLVGYNGTGSVSNAYATGSVIGGTSVGGLVGSNYGGISNAYATGAVSGSGYAVGGLVGFNSTVGVISNAFATGAVSGSGSYLGGLLGYNYAGKVSNAYATGAVSGSGDSVGGLVGFNDNDSVISNAYASGSVTGANSVGGLVGNNNNGSVISNAYATGAVSGSGSYVGGLVGSNDYGSVLGNAYATGAVSGSGSYLGGLVGINYGGISNAYATGTVTGSYSVGGLLGYNDSGTISNSYWTTDTTGQVVGAGGGSAFGATGLTVRELISNLPTGFNSALWGNGNNQTTPYLLGLAGNQVFNLNDLPDTISSTNRPNLYTTILTLDQLQAINSGLSGRYVLGNDIDASATAGWNAGLGFKPIGDTTTVFTGALDGLGHAISGLTINRSNSNNVGLFGANQGELRNIGLLGGSVTGFGNVGGLAGYTGSGSVISNVYASGAVTGYSVVGGLVGYNSTGSVSNAYATGAVIGGNSVGGLVGYNDNGSVISNAYASGSITGADHVGGLVGFNDNGSVISNAYATGAVSGSGYYVGGLVGSNDYGSVLSNAYATGAVSGSSYYVGGLVGSNDNGSVINAYATGAVTGSYSVGGLLGYNDSGTISNSYWTTDTTGQVVGVGGGSAFGATGLTVRELISNLPTGFDSALWGNGNNQTTPYLLGLAGNQVFNLNDLPDTISSTNRPNLYTTILTLDQLQAINSGLSGRYVLGNDIDASATAGWNAGLGFKPIGDTTTVFTGALDGLGHAISGLTINRSNSNYVGLFGFVFGGQLRNIGLLGGSVTGFSSVGGLVGFNDNGSVISNAYATGAVTGTYYVGGLIGFNSTGSVSNAYATGAVSGSAHYVGGLIGSNNNGSVISNAYATGAVTGYSAVGGLVGYNSNGSVISNVYATGAVSGSDNYVGGLLGYNNGTISNSFYATTDSIGANINNAGLTSGNYIGNSFGTGKTWADLTQLSTFAGWGTDIDAAGGTGSVWRIYDGSTTPLLRSFLQAVTVTSTSPTKIYDGLASGSFGYSTDLAGAILEGSAAYFTQSANAGTYSTTNGDLSLGGLYSGQQGYDISYAPTSLTINKAAVTVTANSDSTTYNGQQQSVSGFIASGLVNGEAATVLTGVTTSGGNGTKAGTYTLTASGTDGNYDLTFVDGALTINKAAATVTANSNSTIYNGQQQSASGFTVNGLVNGETASVLSGVTTTGVTGTNVGTYTLTTSGADGNYDLTFVDGALTINKAAATVTANSNSTTYNGQQQNTSGFTVNGLVNGETASVLSGITTTGGSGTNAGTYILKASGADGNYDLTFVDGQLTINKAKASITANSNSTAYNGQQQGSSGFTASGLVNGETATVLTGVKVSGSGTNAGTYTLTASGTDGNYDLTFVDGQLTINKAAATVTANSNSTTYNGQQQSASGFTVNGLVNGETASVLSGITTTGGSGTNAGTYILKASGADGNYDLTFVDGQLTINKAKASITANSNSTTYNGQQQGSSGFTASGLVNGETATVLTGVKVSGSGTNAGTYTLTASGADGNYDLIFVDGQLTINKAKLSVSANSASKTADGNAFFGGNGVNYSGFVTNEDASVLGGQLVYGGSSQGAVGAGVYELSVSGLTANNYSLDYIASTLQVAAQPVPPAPPAPPSVELPSLPAVQYLSALSSAQNTDQSQADQAPVSDAALYRVVDSGIRLPEGI